jgi:hypothetical protein
MDLPDPDQLESTRQTEVAHAFGARVANVLMIAALYVNITGVVIGATLSQLTNAGLIVSVLLGALLPVIGLIGVQWVRLRRARQAAHRARDLLQITPFGEAPGRIAWLAIIVAGLGGAFLPVPNAWVACALLALAVLGPLVRRRRAPETPTWVLGLLGGWVAVAALLAVVMVPVTGPKYAGALALTWLICAPFGFPAALLRGPLTGLMSRTDALGGLARAVAPLLPPAQGASALRESGDPNAALSRLKPALAGDQRVIPLGECLLEAAACLTAIGDPRAVPILGCAAHVLPADPRPFVGLARALAVTDPDRALAYARFAEANAARASFLGGADDARVLREQLEAGPPKAAVAPRQGGSASGGAVVSEG